jgi:anti-sigma B factor antagonist
MSLIVASHGDRTVVTVAGDLDDTVASDFQREIERHLEASTARIDIDLSAVGFCDSSGLRALMIVSRKAADQGIRLTLAAPSTAVQLVLEVSGILHHIPVDTNKPHIPPISGPGTSDPGTDLPMTL